MTGRVVSHGARNRYPATCARCGQRVEPGQGSIMGEPSNWRVVHLDCIPAWEDRNKPS